MFDYISSDLARKRKYYVRIDNFVNKYFKITFQLGTLAAVWFRFGAWVIGLSSALLRGVLTPVYVLGETVMSSLSGVHVNPRTPIGRGFVIHNFSTVFIDAQQIGENFTVNQGASVGPDWRGGKPVVGNNVFVGAGAKVLGGVTVGDNVVIAANALVERSVPDNCTVAGVPARVISRQVTSDYMRFTDT